MLVGYEDLCRRAGVPFNRGKVGRYLCEIAEWCKKEGFPPINALAVVKKTKRPGRGYSKAPGCDKTWPETLGKCLVFSKYPGKV